LDRPAVALPTAPSPKLSLPRLADGGTAMICINKSVALT
jgi:hypothetical protein